MGFKFGRCIYSSGGYSRSVRRGGGGAEVGGAGDEERRGRVGEQVVTHRLNVVIVILIKVAAIASINRAQFC